MRSRGHVLRTQGVDTELDPALVLGDRDRVFMYGGPLPEFDPGVDGTSDVIALALLRGVPPFKWPRDSGVVLPDIVVGVLDVTDGF